MSLFWSTQKYLSFSFQSWKNSILQFKKYRYLYPKTLIIFRWGGGGLGKFHLSIIKIIHFTFFVQRTNASEKSLIALNQAMVIAIKNEILC
jgi:hypothetical protein